MHELSLMQGVMDVVFDSAKHAGATAVLEVHLEVGEMTECIADCLEFAFEALTIDTISEGAKLDITFVGPHSRCNECGCEYDHDRFHMACPECGSGDTELLRGRDLQITSIEVDIPDEDETDAT